jgi:transposase
VSTVEPTPATPSDIATVLARVAALEAHAAAREERNRLLEEENRWLKAQLFGRSSEKTARDQISPDQVWLFNEAEALAKAAEAAPQSLSIPAHERHKRGRKKLAAELPRFKVVHDIAQSEKICAVDGTPLERIGQEISEQLDFKPAQVRVICNIRPKYACPCCHAGVKIAPVPPQLLPKSMATPGLVAQITTAKFVDGLPFYRQEAQWQRLEREGRTAECSSAAHRSMAATI